MFVKNPGSLCGITVLKRVWQYRRKGVHDDTEPLFRLGVGILETLSWESGGVDWSPRCATLE